jgi:hypothetical protein
MSMSVFLCTRDERLICLQRDGRSWTAEPALEGVGAQCVAADGPRVLVGMADGHILRSGDAGDSRDQTCVRVGSITAMAVAE